MHSINLSTAKACILVTFLLQSKSPSEEINKRCPVEPGKMANAKYHTDHSGKRVYFCCAECIDEFNRSPETYLTLGSDRTSVDKGNDKGLQFQELLVFGYSNEKALPMVQVEQQ